MTPKEKLELRKAAENIMHPIVTEVKGRRYTMGIDKDDWATKPHTPDGCPIRVIVEECDAIN